jgi:hypothetical protein
MTVRQFPTKDSVPMQWGFTIFRLLRVHKQRISATLLGDDFAYLHFQRLQILHRDLFDRDPCFDLQL